VLLKETDSSTGFTHEKKNLAGFFLSVLQYRKLGENFFPKKKSINSSIYTRNMEFSKKNPKLKDIETKYLNFFLFGVKTLTLTPSLFPFVKHSEQICSVCEGILYS
jgi:hypothetical protein